MDLSLILISTITLLSHPVVEIRRDNRDIKDVTRVVISYEIYETSLRRVS